VTVLVPTERWGRLAPLLLGVTVLLLVLVFVPRIGATINGARRWLRWGGWYMQPSELAKLTLALFLCATAAANPERLRTFCRGFLPLFAVVAIVCGLIVKEPDVGTSVFIGLTSCVTLLVAGARATHLLSVGGGAAGAAGLLVVMRMPHFVERFMGWWQYETHPGGYQLRQSLIALGAGGWFGEGLGRGTQKLNFLPEVHSDFIFAVLGEEMGYCGVMAVLMLFCALGVVGWRISRSAATPFGALLAFTLTLSIVLQAAINVAVVSGVVPTKGIPLPFFSFGGSSLCFTMAGIGMLIRIANEKGETCESPSPAEEPAVICSRA
jgi:cell division protein FtsW